MSIRNKLLFRFLRNRLFGIFGWRMTEFDVNSGFNLKWSRLVWWLVGFRKQFPVRWLVVFIKIHQIILVLYTIVVRV